MTAGESLLLVLAALGVGALVAYAIVKAAVRHALDGHRIWLEKRVEKQKASHR